MPVTLVGTALLVATMIAAGSAAASYGLAALNYRRALLARAGRVTVYVTLALVASVTLLLLALFFLRRFDIAYVFDYSSRQLPFHFTLSAAWAGQAGSFLLWIVWSGLFAARLVSDKNSVSPVVPAVLLLLVALLLAMTLLVNPFSPLADLAKRGVPADGNGLNPLLQNIWMAIHPPMLFVGYALAAVPFAYALSALVNREYDGWLRQAQPWALTAWSLLGLALLLGGYWAYETQGWGGYWGWDPVENSALVPWLLLTALLHSMHTQRTRRGLRRTTLLLALLSYLAVLYATFLARGGALANFSVHSFVLQGLTTPLAVMVVTISATSMGLLLVRWREVPSQPLSEELLSRDSFITLGVLALVVIALVVEVGTSMPLISALPGFGFALQNLLGPAFALDDGSRLNNLPFADGRFSLSADFYTTTVPPLGLVALALLTVGPLLGGRTVSWRHLIRAARWPMLAAAVATGGSMLVGVRAALPLAYIALGTFAAGANVVMFERTLRGGWLRIGGYLAHVGICVFLLGVVGSTAYASDEVRVALYEGDRTTVFGTEIGFKGWQQTTSASGALEISLRRGNSTVDRQVTYYYYAPANAVMKAPAIQSYLLEDLYIVPADYAPAIDPNQPTLIQGDEATVGPYIITFTGFALPDPQTDQAEIGVNLRIGYGGEIYALTPRAVLEPDGSLSTEARSVRLPGGHMLTLMHLDLTRRLAEIRVEGLGLPIASPERVVFAVSTKPLVQLVWLGVWLSVLGGLIAAVRHWRLQGGRRRDGSIAFS
jgi:cytochrome c-type biogenesis protein CcmF